MALGHGLGAFSQGLVGGIDAAQRMRRNYELDQLYKEQRTDRERARGQAQALATNQYNPETGLVHSGQPMPGEMGPPKPMPAYDHFDALRAQADLIEDPDRRKDQLDRIDKMAMRGMRTHTLLAHTQRQQNNLPGMVDSLNKAMKFISGSMGGFSLDDKGRVVDWNGKEVDDKFMYMLGNAVKDPEGAFEWMRSTREAEEKSRRDEARADQHLKAQEAYWAGSLDVRLAEANAAQAYYGMQGRLKSSDLAAIEKSIDDSFGVLQEDPSYAAIASAMPSQIRSVASDIVAINGPGMDTNQAVQLAAVAADAAFREDLPEEARAAIDENSPYSMFVDRDKDGRLMGQVVKSIGKTADGQDQHVPMSSMFLLPERVIRRINLTGEKTPPPKPQGLPYTPENYPGALTAPRLRSEAIKGGALAP